MRNYRALALRAVIASIALAVLGSCGQSDTIAADPEQRPVPYAKDASLDSVEDMGPGASRVAAPASAPLWTTRPVSAEAAAQLSRLRERFFEMPARAAAAADPTSDPAVSDPGATGGSSAASEDGGAAETDIVDAGDPDELPEQGATSALLPGLAERFEENRGGLRPQFAQGMTESARVLLPLRATSATRLEDTASGVAIEFALEDAREARGEVAEGYVVYERGHAAAATVLRRAMRDGMEDFLSFDERPAVSAVTYKVVLGKGVRGLRLVANTLEMLDADGAPRLHVAPPYVIGADHVRTDAKLAVEGCAVDIDPAPPWGRAVTPPGEETCTVRVSWNEQAVVYPALLDPKWTSAATMATERQLHTATMLSTGKVLVVGGTSNGTAALATAELFDPSTNTWAGTGSMTGPSAARMRHSASQLATSSNTMTSGKILVAGGWTGTQSISTTKLYSPTGGTWIEGADMGTPRHAHTATVLFDGRVLAVGGMGGTTVFQTATLYDPHPNGSDVGEWNSTPNLPSNQRRRYHTATRLSTTNPTLSNHVLVVGGNSGGTTSLATVVKFNPTAGTWSTLTPLATAREGHTATVLSDGRVIIAGGKNVSTMLPLALLYDPGTSGSGTWSNAGNLNVARQQHTATLLSTGVLGNGLVLVAGGSPNSTGTPSSNSAELFQFVSGTPTWTATAPLFEISRDHSANLLGNGRVLIAGGMTTSLPVNKVQIYDPSLALSCTTPAQCASGHCAQGVCCDAPCTGECSACNLAGSQGTCTAQPAETACTDDGNPCTVDRCDGTLLTCQHPAGNVGATCRASTGLCDLAETCSGSSPTCPADVPAPIGSSCSDGNACNGDETCSAGGVCQAGPPPNLDDGNPCTADACDAVTGITHTPIVGASCSDSNACNGAETCGAGGVCTAGPPPVIDDGNPCTVDSCDPTTGVSHIPTAGAGCTAQGAITFYMPYESPLAAPAIAGGSPTPNSSDPIQLAPGLFGQAANSATPYISWPAAGNIDLGRAGSVSFWIKPDQWTAVNWIVTVYGGERKFMVYSRDGALYSRMEHNGGAQEAVEVTQGDISTWGTTDNSWHLVVATWGSDYVGLSLDGAPTSTASATWLPAIPGGPGGLLFAGGDNYAGFLRDELMVFNRTLWDGDIAWMWGTRSAPSSPNPAIAQFGTSPIASAQGAITFYMPFEGAGTTSTIAGGSSTPTTTDPVVPTLGLFGQAATRETKNIHWFSEGNLDLSRAGSVSFWIKPDQWTAVNWIFIVYGGERKFMVYSRDGALYSRMEHHGTSSAVEVTQGDISNWGTDTGWHLVVATWGPDYVGLSLDGAATKTASASWLTAVPGGPGGFFISGGDQGFLRDELMVLNRTLWDGEIAWTWGTRNTTSAWNPAIAKFGMSPSTTTQGAVTFYVPYEGAGTLASIAGGSPAATTSDPIAPAPGLFGQAARSDAPQIAWPKTSNIDLGRAGSVSFWIKPDQWTASNSIFTAEDGVRKFKVYSHDGALYGRMEHNGGSDAVEVTQGDISTWGTTDTSWHLVVATWGFDYVGLSLDGAPTQTASATWLRALSGGTGGLLYAGGDTHQGFLRDELMVLNRPLWDGEIAWMWGTRTAASAWNPAIAKFGVSPNATTQAAITFYMPYEGTGTLASIAGGSPAAMLPDLIETAPGLFGQAVKSQTKYIPWQKAGNIDLTRPGSVSFWIKPDQWTAVNWMFIGYDGERKFLVYSRDGALYSRMEHNGQSNAVEVTQGDISTWSTDNSWHLIVATWGLDYVGLSLDGAPTKTATATWLPALAGGAGSFYAAGENSHGFLRDELLVFNRTLWDGEIEWMWGTRTTTSAWNPAIAKFGVSPIAPTQGAVTFYVPFEGDGATATIAGGLPTPTTVAPIVKTSGLFGKAVKSETEHVGWDKAGNVDLSHPGSVSFWIKPDGWTEVNWPFIVYDGERKFFVYSRDGALYCRMEHFTSTEFVEVTQGDISSWGTDNNWHLVVATWGSDYVGLSLDGAPIQTASAPWLPAIPAGGGAVFAGGQNYEGFLLDELIVLNRTVSDSDIAWMWGTRSTASTWNPAIGRFGGRYCASVPPPIVDDGNPCTVDTCDPLTGPHYVPLPPGASCTDGNACNGAETCVAGAICQPGTPPMVDDGNACTTDACDPVAGVTHAAVAAGTSCSDGNACNGAETCSASGACLAGTPPAGRCVSLYSASFHQSPVRGEPDDVLLLAGSGLASNDRVVYKALSNTTLPLVAPTSVPTTSTAGEGLASVVNIPNTAGWLDSLTVILPEALISGSSYALWVVTADGQWSNGVKINDARPLWISPDNGYVSASRPDVPRQLKVIGRNLIAKPGHQTMVRLTSTAATITVSAADDADPTTTIEQYVAKINLPSSMPAGEYSVSVQRDGTSWAPLIGQKFTVVPDPAAKPQFLVSNAGGCVADDGLDDTGCVAGAIAAAAANPGGGTVVFGPGRWDLLSPNGLPAPWQGVVLQDGVNLTGATGSTPSTVRVGAAWNVDPNGTSSRKTVFSVVGHNWITKIHFEDGRPHPPNDTELEGFFYIGRPHVDEAVDEVVFAGNEFAYPSMAIAGNGFPVKHLFVVNNVFGAHHVAIRIIDAWNRPDVPFRIDESIITGNTFKPTSFVSACDYTGSAGTALKGLFHVDYSGNVFDGHATDYLGPQPVPGWGRGSLFHEDNEMSLVSQNTYSCTGDKAGYGEAIAYLGSDTVGFIAAKLAGAATANSVTVSTSDGVGLVTHAHNVPVPLESYYVDHWIQVAKGKGLGQARKITSYTVDTTGQSVTFVVSPNWDVLPDASSSLTVNHGFWQVYTVDNNIDNTGCTKANQNGIKTQGGITLNAPAIDMVVEGNLQRQSGGIIVSSSYMFNGTSNPRWQRLQSFVDVQRNRILEEGDYASRCSTGGIGLHCDAVTGPDISTMPASPVVTVYALNVARNQITEADALRGGGLSFAATSFNAAGSRSYQNTLVHHNTFTDLTPPANPGTTTTSVCPGGTQNCPDDPIRDTAVNITAPEIHSTVLYKNTLNNVTTAVIDNGTNTVQCITAGDCSTGTCGGAPIDDGNPCTADTCNPVTGAAVHTPVGAGTSCADSNICNGYETCNGAGACTAGTPPSIDDGNPCTTDFCNPLAGAQHVPAPAGASCSDSNVCNGNETCDATGTCTPGQPLDTSDGNLCTQDSCNPSTGPVHDPEPSGTNCGDGNICNGIEMCDGAGTCVTSGGPPTEDDNPCTDYTGCDPMTGGIHTPRPVGTSCDSLCLSGGVGTCNAGGTCVGETAVTCTASNVCHGVGTCSPSTGVCSDPALPDGTVCDDGSTCTQGDTCLYGVCGGASSSCTQECPCDYGRSCTSDFECRFGMICGQQNGRFFDKDPLSSNCWSPECSTSPYTLGCGYAGAPCGACPPAPPRACAGDTQCQTTNEVCGQGNGVAFELGNVNVCWPPSCAGGQTYCGSPLAPCGNCACVRDCASKTCITPNKHDGCDGYCTGLCGDGQTGCTSNLDCQGNSICFQETCMPPICVELDPTRGCPANHPLCPTCPTCASQCAEEGRECGPDPAGCAAGCGTCGGGLACVNGHCQPGEPAPPPIEPQTAPVGTLEGSFDVTDSGMAQYGIHLTLPPGRASLAPEIGLLYVSDKAIGPAGMGWRLTGFSSIERCTDRLEGEGPRAVKYTPDDHYCLDGKRLVKMGDGSYRTEIDEFSKIVVDGLGAGGHPNAFKVHKKAGTLLTYGATENSSIRHDLAGVPAITVKRTWALSRIDDRNGNAIHFTYETRSFAAGIGPGGLRDSFEMVPKEVSYGSNVVGFEDDRGVRFEYEDVPVHAVHFASGGASHTQRRLRVIETYARANLIARRYRFDYEERGLISLLKSAKECAPIPGGGEICKPETTFQYDDLPAFVAGAPLQRPPRSSWSGVSADLNGDGKDEWSTGGGYTPYNGSAQYPSAAAGNTIDINNDGSEELLWWPVRPGNELLVFYSPGALNVTPTSTTYRFTGNWTPAYAYPADLDGDGIKDIMVCRDDLAQLGYIKGGAHPDPDSSGIKNLGAIRQLPVFGKCEIDNPLFLDFDDDGVVNLMRPDPDNRPKWKALVFPENTALGPTWVDVGFSPVGSGYRQLLDANGDGLTDVVLDKGDGPGSLLINQGDGLFRQVDSPVFGPKVAFDMDGDGNDEIYQQYNKVRWTPPALSPLLETRSSPSRFITFNTTGVAPGMEGNFNPLLIDENGDGDLDLVTAQLPQGGGPPCEPNAVGQAERVWLGCPPTISYGHSRRMHLLKSIVDGVGRRIQVYYDGRPVSESDPDDPQTDPPACRGQADLTCPRKFPPLVSEHRFSTVSPGSDTHARKHFEYKYIAARAGTDGHGSFGFGKRIINEYDGIPGQDARGDLFSTTKLVYFNADFARAGLLKSRTVTTAKMTEDVPGFLRPARRVTEEVRDYGLKKPGCPLSTPICPEGPNDFSVFPVLRSSTSRTFDLPDAVRQIVSTEVNTFATSAVNTEYDNHGNSIYHLRQVYAGDVAPANLVTQSLTNRNFKPDVAGNWLVGLMGMMQVEDKRGVDGIPDTRMWNYTYDDASGRLTGRVRGFGSPYEQVEEFHYEDPVHNLTRHVMQPNGPGARTTIINYDDARLIFPYEIFNALNQRTRTDVDPRHGGVIRTLSCAGACPADPSNLVEIRTYDAFGRLTKVQGPSSTMRITLKRGDEEQAPFPEHDPRAVMRVMTEELSTAGTPGAMKVEDYGPLGEILKRAIAGYQDPPPVVDPPAPVVDRWVEELFYYDHYGRLSAQARPHLAGTSEPQGQIEFRYDGTGQLVEEIYPGETGVTTSVHHASATRNTWLLDPANYLVGAGVVAQVVSNRVLSADGPASAFGTANIRIVAPDGSAVTARDPASIFTEYVYGPFQQLESVQVAGDFGSHRTTIEYDPYGRKTSMTDPDTGTESYDGYNAFDELISTTNARGINKRYDYDDIGRLKGALVYITGVPQQDPPDEVTTWEYDGIAGEPTTGNRELGRLVRVSSGSGAEPDRHRTRYRYRPGTGLLESLERKIVAETFTTIFNYDDNFRRLDVVEYPSEGGVFAVRRRYDARGNLTALENASTGAPYWQVTHTSQGYRVSGEKFGNNVVNGITYEPSTGRLERIHTASQEGAPLLGFDYSYTPNGNLESRINTVTGRDERFGYDNLDRLRTINTNQQGDVEVARYNFRGNFEMKLGVGTYTYGTPSDPKPIHAPRTIENGGVTRVFHYDASGNERMRTDGPEGIRQTGYTSFNLPLSISDTLPQPSTTTFEYDGDHSRVIKVQNSVRQTIYAGNLYERITDSSGGPSVVTHKYRIFADGKQVAQVERTEGTPVDKTIYLHADHLGSTQVISRSTPPVQSSDVYTQLFDPWGKPEVEAAWDPTAPDDIRNVHAGFTGHEHDPEHRLINMRGRIYDPEIGRFMSADLIVQAPFYSQSFNRYAYAFNNPLAYVDPSGFKLDPSNSGRATRHVGDQEPGYIAGGGLAFITVDVITPSKASGLPKKDAKGAKGKNSTASVPGANKDPRVNTPPKGPQKPRGTGHHLLPPEKLPTGLPTGRNSDFHDPAQALTVSPQEGMPRTLPQREAGSSADAAVAITMTAPRVVGPALETGAVVGRSATLLGGVATVLSGILAGVAVLIYPSEIAADEPYLAKPGTYATPEELPRDPRTGNPIPESSDPHTQIGTRQGSDGIPYPQAREFGENGKPVRDIDFTNHGRRDHVNPHQHDYDPKTGKRSRAVPFVP